MARRGAGEGRGAARPKEGQGKPQAKEAWGKLRVPQRREMHGRAVTPAVRERLAELWRERERDRQIERERERLLAGNRHQ